MRRLNTRKIWPQLALLMAFTAGNTALASEVDHREFDATLHVQYKGDPDQAEARSFTLNFEYPHVERAQDVSWRLELVAPDGQVVQRWQGVERLFQKPAEVKVRWGGRAEQALLADGIYTVRLAAASHEAGKGKDKAAAGDVDKAIAAAEEVIEQSWDIAVGKLEPASMPAFRPMATAGPAGGREKQGAPALELQKAAPATTSLPYTVYYANLHSQTNHSDGGGALASCTGAQAPQSGAYGPADAFAYAKAKGLDILMASEHNHMYDGSDSTNTAAAPSTAKALYQSGLTAAADFSAANPGFLAVYGMEWGVINNGGHMNIYNSPELLEWELNSSGQLIGDTLTVKGDYAGLYSLMRQRGWIGQFNHPASSGQFLVNGTPLGYTSDGDQAMVACEVLNTSAFSTNTNETETGRSSYEGACNKALEAGYHVAFVSDQDNHCANWGASYTNRTGILIPNGVALTQTSFVDAMRARRVFATMDKNSQLVLTANGHLMGERFTNSGPLNLVANYASTGGQSASTVLIYEGVPGRNGTVSQLAAAASASVTPAVGEHFYYAKVTQGDGKILWSAPVWVTQSAGGDTTAPSVAAAETGSSGSITLSASASDNVGVTLVEFYIDGALKASSSAAPYSAAFNSATLANGSHSLVARAYDAAGNVGVSAPVSFSVSNAASDTTAPAVTAGESGASGTITLSASASDNVGVSKVEFYVDGVLKGTDTASPYSMTLNSTTLSNGSHALTARAYDAAGNSTLSAAVNFSISNATTTQLVLNSGFESGAASWTATSGVITSDSSMAAHGGSYKAWLNGYGAAHTDSVYQSVSIASTATSATLKFWLKITSDETTTTNAYDTLKVQLRDSGNNVLATLATYSNLNKGSSYLEKSFDLSAYKGQTVRIHFLGEEGSTVATSFVVDAVTRTVQ